MGKESLHSSHETLYAIVSFSILSVEQPKKDLVVRNGSD